MGGPISVKQTSQTNLYLIFKIVQIVGDNKEVSAQKCFQWSQNRPKNRKVPSVKQNLLEQFFASSTANLTSAPLGRDTEDA